jgi:hypothetical protein
MNSLAMCLPAFIIIAHTKSRWWTLFPDGRIFGQITQNSPQNISFGREKLVAGKSTICSKVAEKRPKNLS